MNGIALLLVVNLTSVICAIGSVWLASQGKEGWGWLLLVAAALHTFPNGTHS